MSKAFTLIELLIVVAIVAILSAIALPNLLEAQKRAKVASVSSGMRAVAAAIEAYAVDNNQYPLTLDDHDQVMHMMNNMRMAFVPRSVTTPIAYMNEIPLDNFFPRTMEQMHHGEKIVHSHTYLYINQGNTPESMLQEYRIQVEERASDSVDAPEWALYSTGPDSAYGVRQMLMESTMPPKYGLMYNPATSPVHYDPTNGAASHGDIVRFSGE